MLWRFLRIAFITDPLAAIEIVLMGLTCVAGHLIDRQGHLGFRIVAFWSRLLLFTSGVKLESSGQDVVPRGRGVVLVANHQSMLDVPVLMACLPVSFRFMAKKSLFKFPFIGWNLSLGGHIRVDREDKRAAVRALADARRVLERGASVLVFAEGSRAVSGMRDFKAGAAHLAIKTGAPLVPIGVSGTRDALPRGSIHIRPERVTVRIGAPIETAGLSPADGEALTRRLQTSVAGLIAKASREAA